MKPVLHHIQICVKNSSAVLSSLQKFGFYLFAYRTTEICDSFALKVGSTIFVVTERKKTPSCCHLRSTMTIVCCENEEQHLVDTVFNVAFCVKDVKESTKIVSLKGGTILEPPTVLRDRFGEIEFSIIKSPCGNVIHTLINKESYDGVFLPGFELVRLENDRGNDCELNELVTQIDHITFACHPGDSSFLIKFYEDCFAMRRFSINNNDDTDEGFILKGGVGLRLKALEFSRFEETALSFLCEEKKSVMEEKNPQNTNETMLVIVETLPGQTNCNVDTFLKEHGKAGVEHIALSTNCIIRTVSKMVCRGVNFRKPPEAYYKEISKEYERKNKGSKHYEHIDSLKKLGILIDSEGFSSSSSSPNIAKVEDEPRYLMQIFSRPIFERKTFFLELIQRCGARGLGEGNIIALVRCIREEAAQKKQQKSSAFFTVEANAQDYKGQLRS